MNYEQRKQRAIENVGGLLADGRGDAEYRDQIAAEQAAEDREYEDNRDVNDIFSNSVKPSLKRAIESAGESAFCRARSADHLSDEDRAAEIFGGDPRDDSADDEDDGEVWS